jgi:hypothetical protein
MEAVAVEAARAQGMSGEELARMLHLPVVDAASRIGGCHYPPRQPPKSCDLLFQFLF